jgi:membrane protease YdiL (CAAX protease family)
MMWPIANVYLSSAGRGRTDGWRYGVAGLVALLLGVTIGALILLGVQLTGRLPADLATRMQDPSEPRIFFAAIAANFLSLLAGLVLAARWIQAKRFTDLLGAWSWRQAAAGAAAWAVILAALTGLDALIAPEGFAVTVSPATAGLALAAVLGLVPQIFAEEVIFRGWLTQGLALAFRRPLPAALVSGILFGSIHLPNGVPQAVSATIFGVLMALIAMRLGGIAFTTGLHLVNNVFAAVVVVSGQDVFRGVPGVFSQSTPQLMAFDVAASGLAQALLALAAGRFLGPKAAAEASEASRPALGEPAHIPPRL